MAAEISGRTVNAGTASMPPAAAPREAGAAQPEDGPAQPGTGPTEAGAGPARPGAGPAHGSMPPETGPLRPGTKSGQPTPGAGQPAPGRQPPGPPAQSDDELEAVKRYVLLGIAVRILDHDIRVVDSSRLKLPRFYESILRGLQDRVLLELAALRRMFRTSGIKIYEERKEADGLTAAYVCRGYHHTFTMPWSFVRAEAERLLKRYTAPD